MIALENGNSLLVDALIKQVEVSITGDVSDDGKTVLHYFAMNSDQHELTEAFTEMVSHFFSLNSSQCVDF